MAAGSHLEKGSWALLVIPATTTKTMVFPSKEEFEEKIINQCPCRTIIPIINRTITSPIRLNKIVIIPAARDFMF